MTYFEVDSYFWYMVNFVRCTLVSYFDDSCDALITQTRKC